MRSFAAFVILTLCLLLTACGTFINDPLSSDTTQSSDSGGCSDYITFQKPDGQYACDEMIWIDGKLYYFDLNGHLDTTSKWRRIGGEWYMIGADGYALRNQWYGSYYLLDDGVMAKDRYIDRFYVDENGYWSTNSWKEGDWLVEGKWTYKKDAWIYEHDGIEQKIDLSQMRSINRLGYDTGADGKLPQQSLIAYKSAIDNGFRILLCDLQFTGDDVPVCFHDLSINDKARNRDGSDIATVADGEKLTDEDRIFIKDHTYDELSEYDYGIYKGEEYAGTGLLVLKDMLDFCAGNPVDELYIEIKDGTEEQIASAVRLVKGYSIRVSWAGTTIEQCRAVINADPDARIATMPYKVDQETIDELLTLRTHTNEVFIFAYGNAILTDENVALMKRYDIPFEMGTIDSEEEILRYWNEAYLYCSGIESNRVVASLIDIDKLLTGREAKR